MSIQRQIEDFVRGVLSEVPRPLTEHVICDVFRLIERSDVWRRGYDRFVDETRRGREGDIKGGRDTVNPLIGKAVRAVLGAETIGTASAPECCTLIRSRYTILRVPPGA